MTPFALALVWCMLHVSAFTLLALVVYFIARCRGPALAAWIATLALAVIGPLTVLSLSPWPNWLTVDLGAVARSLETDPAPERLLTAEELHGPIIGDAGAANRLPKNEVSAAVERQDGARGEIAAAPAGRRGWFNLAGSSQRDGWATLFLVAVGAGITFGCARFMAALLIVRGYRRRSKPLTDDSLTRLSGELAASAGVSAHVELRESSAVVTPATIGSWRPAVLLPPDWATWSEVERRAVLAHEMANIARRDYLGCLVARLAQVLHFYHPLVHVLARRLHFEQELTADAWAMQASGGRDAYLASLARLALASDGAPRLSPARMFLPARGTLLRRIDMLRTATVKTRRAERSANELRGSQPMRLVVATMLCLLALLAAGVRGPRADEPRQDGPGDFVFTGRIEFDVDLPDHVFVPASADTVIVAKPLVLAGGQAESSGFDLQQLFPQAELISSLPDESISLIAMSGKGALLTTPGSAREELLIVIAAGASDWEQIVSDSGYKVARQTQDDVSYFTVGERSDIVAVPLDERTLIIGRPAEQTLAFAARRSGSGGDDAAGDRRIDVDPDAPMVASIDADARRALFEGMRRDARFGQFIVPIEQGMESFALKVLDRDATRVQAVLHFRSPEAAKRSAEMIQSLATLLAGIIETELAQKQDRAAPRPLNREDQAMVSAVEALAAAEFGIEEQKVVITAQAPRDLWPFLGVFRAAQSAGQRTAAMNKLKHIALAFHNAHTVDARFLGACRFCRISNRAIGSSTPNSISMNPGTARTTSSSSKRCRTCTASRVRRRTTIRRRSTRSPVPALRSMERKERGSATSPMVHRIRSSSSTPSATCRGPSRRNWSSNPTANCPSSAGTWKTDCTWPCSPTVTFGRCRGRLTRI